MNTSAAASDWNGPPTSSLWTSQKTIDGYRAALFEKLKVKSRVGLVGLVLYAIREGIFHLR